MGTCYQFLLPFTTNILDILEVSTIGVYTTSVETTSVETTGVETTIYYPLLVSTNSLDSNF